VSDANALQHVGAHNLPGPVAAGGAVHVDGDAGVVFCSQHVSKKLNSMRQLVYVPHKRFQHGAPSDFWESGRRSYAGESQGPIDERTVLGIPGVFPEI
jgi:hypothetical protein